MTAGQHKQRRAESERHPRHIRPETADSMRGAGVMHRQRRFVTHTTLHHRQSALRTFVPWQTVGIVLTIAALVYGLITAPLTTGIVTVTILTTFYFLDAAFNFYLVIRSLRTPPEIVSTPAELAALDNEDLPVYSVLCPLYREAHMLPTFVAAMTRLDWPADKLDILLLLEENDTASIAAARAMDLPPSVRIVVVPHSLPKTKPKACNYGLSLVRGDYVVIYDAEDIPDPQQLRKAYLGFRAAGSDVRCLQAKLNYFNPDQNLLTRLFTAEYSLWFDVVLPGLQSIDTSIPLGGTSNHFRTADLRELEGWDPFNVTEDCDLGMRIFKRGYRTAIIDSVTLEEANSHLGNWLRQRSRWIKGYMQTYLVHMRHPLAFVRDHGVHAFVFQAVIGGKVAVLFVNPFLWAATIGYFTFRTTLGPVVEALYPPFVFYIAVTTLVFGNFLYLYYYMIGAAKRGQYQVIKYAFLVPLYWLLVSVAAIVALYQLIVKPHYWEKTRHGLHLPEADQQHAATLPDIPTPSPRPAWVSWILSDEGALIYALLVANIINFAFNVFLGRTLAPADFGTVTLLGTLWYLAMTVTGALTQAATHAAANAGRGAYAGTLRAATAVTTAATVLWIAAVPLLSSYFRLESAVVLLSMTPVLPLAVLAAAGRGTLQGLLRFPSVAAIFLTEAAVRFVVGAACVVGGVPSAAYLAIPLSVAAAALAAVVAMRQVPNNSERQFVFPRRFFAATVVANAATIVFLSADMLLVKHYLTPTDAGAYALLALTGKIIFFCGSLASTFLTTFVARALAEGRDTRIVLRHTLVATALTAGGTAVLLGPLGAVTVPLLLGDGALRIVPYLAPYATGMAAFAVAGVIAAYHIARHASWFALVPLTAAAGMIGGIALYHGDIGDVAMAVAISGASTLVAAILAHTAVTSGWVVRRAGHDLADVFDDRLPLPRHTLGTLRILILNWRDMRHTHAGGAETYIHELARIWVRQGNQVTVFCGNDGRSARAETVDGVTVIRRGGFYLVYLWAFLYYMLRLRGKFDVVLDCQNGVPFFAPLYVREPVVGLMHHVHQRVFRIMLPAPMATAAAWIERRLMPVVYAHTPFVTVSASSRDDMRALGLGRAGIDTVSPGVRRSADRTMGRDATPTVLYLGRLKTYKSVDVLLRAWERVHRIRPDARLTIAGDGDDSDRLRRLADALGLTAMVTFTGRVDEMTKDTLLQKSWLLVQPSAHEGWGIVVMEAAAAGTPVIAADAPGLRDSVIDSVTGLLVPHGDVAALADRILHLIGDDALRARLGDSGRARAAMFDWQTAADAVMHVIRRSARHVPDRHQRIRP